MTLIGSTCQEERVGEFRSVAMTVKAQKNSLGWYIKDAVEPLLKHTKKAGIIKIENCVAKQQFKQEMNQKKNRMKERKIVEGKTCTVDLQGMSTTRQSGYGGRVTKTEKLICATYDQASKT